MKTKCQLNIEVCICVSLFCHQLLTFQLSGITNHSLLVAPNDQRIGNSTKKHQPFKHIYYGAFWEATPKILKMYLFINPKDPIKVKYRYTHVTHSMTLFVDAKQSDAHLKVMCQVMASKHVVCKQIIQRRR